MKLKEEELTNYFHNKFKEEGKYIGKRFIRECLKEGSKQTLKDELEFLKSIMGNFNIVYYDMQITERIKQIEKELMEMAK